MNQHSQEKKSIKELVLTQIKEGKAIMRPKWHFVFKGVLVTLGVVLVTLVILYIVSFLIFVLREAGVLFIPAFGLGGLGAFLLSIPWVLVLVAGLFFFFLEILVRRYSFAYKKPLVYSLLGIIGIVVIGSGVVLVTGVHQNLSQRAEEIGVPFVGPLYRGYLPEQFELVHGGAIEKITDEGFLLLDRRGDEFEIIVTSKTMIAPDLELLAGTSVMVVGEEREKVIEAMGIRRAIREFNPKKDEGRFRMAPPQKNFLR